MTEVPETPAPPIDLELRLEDHRVLVEALTGGGYRFLGGKIREAMTYGEGEALVLRARAAQLGCRIRPPKPVGRA